MAKPITFNCLYDKLGKQPYRNMHATVTLKISAEHLKNLMHSSDTELRVPLTLKFSKDGKPYFSAE